MQGPTTFLPREWNSFFAALSSPERYDAALRLCRKAVAQAQLALPEIDQAIIALATGHPGQPLIDQVQAIVDRLEAEYDAILGDDEGKLAYVGVMRADAALYDPIVPKQSKSKRGRKPGKGPRLPNPKEAVKKADGNRRGQGAWTWQSSQTQSTPGRPQRPTCINYLMTSQTTWLSPIDLLEICES